jgi:hypothetical protein
MADLPLDRKSKKALEPDSTVAPVAPAFPAGDPGKIIVTHENADLLAVHFLAQIFSRLGYIVKLLEEKK